MTEATSYESFLEWSQQSTERVFISDMTSNTVGRDISHSTAHPVGCEITAEELEWLMRFYSIVEYDIGTEDYVRNQLFGEGMSIITNPLPYMAIAEIAKYPRNFICVEEVVLKTLAWKELKKYPNLTSGVFNLIDRYLKEFHKSRPDMNFVELTHRLHLYKGLANAINLGRVGRIELPICSTIERCWGWLEDFASQYTTMQTNAREA